MFTWLRRRKSFRRATFPFFDGRSWRRADPIAVNISFASDPEYNESVHPLQAENGDPAAMDVVLNATARAFDVDRYDSKTGRGMIADELFDLFMDFGEWSMSKKNIGELLPTSAKRSEPTYQHSYEPTTKPTSDSGSTSTEPDYEEPGASTEQFDGKESEPVA